MVILRSAMIVVVVLRDRRRVARIDSAPGLLVVSGMLGSCMLHIYALRTLI